jgi:8-oxo-dGTP pyrophosphatase MutT (NUDIX family)
VETVSRPAVRIICLDADDRVLLLLWQDPSDGGLLWEPPGGGIDPGETPIETARRELVEETGLDPAAIGPESVIVERDTRWNGKRFVGPEPFFLARYPDLVAPEISRAGLLPDEQLNLRGHYWLSRTEIAALIEPLVPATLLAEIRRLAPDWPRL